MKKISCLLLAVTLGLIAVSQQPTVIAYFAGRTSQIDSFEANKLTHIIYSFCHLKGNRLSLDSDAEKVKIGKLVALKKKHPSLKIMLSLGGWGGCKTCSPVFNTAKGRNEFASSVRQLNNELNTDGIDLDWEYPAIEGHPGHAFNASDKPAFTLLVSALRKELGAKHEISFAAGGFTQFIDSSIEWEKVMPLVDRVNLMSYDLINGYSSTTGHHTALYSTPQQSESTDNGVRKLLAVGVPASKIVIGAAFYARVFKIEDTAQHGLYQACKFDRYVPYATLDAFLSGADWQSFFDPVAKAIWSFNARERLFATYDEASSIKAKTAYVVSNKLNGIMFWQLAEDKMRGGLVDAIHKTLNGQ